MARTKTYIAGDWTGDKELIEQLYKWNDSDYWNLHFIDAHEITQARDDSLYCTVKRSLSERLNVSKTFVLIVGSETLSLTKGSCRYCQSYDSFHTSCHRRYNVDFRSYINYECEKAAKEIPNIVVIYNYSTIEKSKCPEAVRNIGKHINGYYKGNDGKWYWNYKTIKEAIMN